MFIMTFTFNTITTGIRITNKFDAPSFISGLLISYFCQRQSEKSHENKINKNKNNSKVQKQCEKVQRKEKISNKNF